MTINLKPDQERIIQAEIESGHFGSPDEVLDHALVALQEKEHRRRASPPARTWRSSSWNRHWRVRD
jgi:Arc/MetJ-type ribon-helix-helix transcriptional regulator